MDANWVEKKNADSTSAYFGDVHRLAEYITEKEEQGYDFSYRDAYAKILLEQDNLAKESHQLVNYHMLAMASWVLLFKNGEFCKELDEKYGKGFCRQLAKMDDFDPNAADKLADQTFELASGDYVITDPAYFEDRDMSLLENWMYDIMPSLHMHGTLCGNWECAVFEATGGKDIDDMALPERIEAACGRFNAISSTVCVASLRDVEAYDSAFAERVEKAVEGNPLACSYAAVIRNFRGTGHFEIKETFYACDSGTKLTGYVLFVVLDGIDTETGEAVRYESRPLPVAWPYSQMQ